MKSTRQILLGGMLAAAILAVAPSAWTQQINGTPGDPSATVTIDGKQIPPPPMPFGGVIKKARLPSGIAPDRGNCKRRSQLSEADRKAVDEAYAKAND